MNAIFTFLKGGTGSGNFGHAGRPGEVGGSSPGGGGISGTVARNLSDLTAQIHSTGPDGGFTFHAITKDQPRSGFAVSLYKDRERKLDAKDCTVNEIADYVVRNWDLLSKENNYIGGWVNPEDNKVYLDVSTVVRSADEAFRLGKAHKQIAYFDLAKGESVTIH